MRAEATWDQCVCTQTQVLSTSELTLTELPYITATVYHATDDEEFLRMRRRGRACTRARHNEEEAWCF